MYVLISHIFNYLKILSHIFDYLKHFHQVFAVYNA